MGRNYDKDTIALVRYGIIFLKSHHNDQKVIQEMHAIMKCYGIKGMSEFIDNMSQCAPEALECLAEEIMGIFVSKEERSG